MPDLIYIPAPNADGDCVNCNPTDPCGVVIPCNDCDPQLSSQYSVTFSGLNWDYPCIEMNGQVFVLTWTSLCNWENEIPQKQDFLLHWDTVDDVWVLDVQYANDLGQVCIYQFLGPQTPCDPRGVYTPNHGAGTGVIS